MANDRPQIAIISDEITPYRLHVLNRIARELPQVALHSIFTNTQPSMPWQIQMDEKIGPVTFPEWSLNDRQRISVHSAPLFRCIRDYLLGRSIRLVILLGYNDLTRFLLIRWSHRNSLPLLLTGDSNVFNEGERGLLFRTIKRLYVGHVVDLVAGVMPMGTCGRAYYRLYADHSKPTFLFPYEPDYDKLATCDPAAREAFLRRYGLIPARRRLLYSGRLAAVKNVGLLLAAFEQIIEYRPDWDLVVAGDGPLRGELQARVPLRMRDRIKWLGFLQFEDMIPCYHCCDALVLPSAREPWALVINEAVAAGLPVVATYVAGAAVELVSDQVNGLLVPPGDLEALRNALVEITHPDRNQEMRRAAPAALQRWRRAADPVEGVRLALRHFRIIL